MENSYEEDLIHQIQNGNDQAFLILYEEYVHSIHSFVLHMLQVPTLAEEVTQDTFLKLWNHAEQYHAERGSLRAWLMAIARNTALDCLRHETRISPTRDGQASEVLQEIPDLNTVSDEARWHSMGLAVQDLSEKQRKVIEMTFYQGLTQNDIAEILGWPLGTVKTRLRAAIEQLRMVWVE